MLRIRLDPLLGLALPALLPPRERRPALDHVVTAPPHPSLIESPVRLAVRAEDIERALVESLAQVFRNLARVPCPIGLLDFLLVRWANVPHQAGPRPAGDEEMNRDVGCGRVRPEVVAEVLGDVFHGRLGGVVRGICAAGRIGDALFGSGQNDGFRGLARRGDQKGQEDRESVQGAEDVRVEGLGNQISF